MEKQSRQSQKKGITLKVQHKLCHNFHHFHHFNYLPQFSHLSKYAGSDIIFCSVIPHVKAFTWSWCSTRSHHILHKLACRVLQVFCFRDTITLTGTVACQCQLVPSTGKEWDEVEPLCINCSHYLMMHSIHGEIAQTILGPCGIPSFFVLQLYQYLPTQKVFTCL